MRVGVVSIVFAVLLAGCTGAPGTEDEVPIEDNESQDQNLPALPVDVMFSNITADAPFTVNLTSSLAANETINVTWSYEVLAAMGNATGNETNATTEPLPTGEGVGLPASFNLTLGLGNYTFHMMASLDGYADVNLEVPVLVPEGIAVFVDDEADPCAGAATQDDLAFSGTATGGVLGNPAGPTHSFEVLPCQTKMTIDLSYLETGGDMDVDVFDPTGAEAGAGASGSIGGEGPIVIDGPLMAGEWTVEVVYFSSGPATYDLTVTFG